jgi:hypothetical protein
MTAELATWNIAAAFATLMRNAKRFAFTLF